MLAMQYKIQLPDDFDMNLIRQRVRENGTKTDGFQDLIFKAYLISTKGELDAQENQYAPLYLWSGVDGMNQFIWQGFYDNILKSFGWQQIPIGVPLSFQRSEDFLSARFCLELKRAIPESATMQELTFSCDTDQDVARLLIYNPDKWECSEYYFFQNLPEQTEGMKIFEILHISV